MGVAAALLDILEDVKIEEARFAAGNALLQVTSRGNAFAISSLWYKLEHPHCQVRYIAYKTLVSLIEPDDPLFLSVVRKVFEAAEEEPLMESLVLVLQQS